MKYGGLTNDCDVFAQSAKTSQHQVYAINLKCLLIFRTAGNIPESDRNFELLITKHTIRLVLSGRSAKSYARSDPAALQSHQYADLHHLECFQGSLLSQNP